MLNTEHSFRYMNVRRMIGEYMEKLWTVPEKKESIV